MRNFLLFAFMSAALPTGSFALEIERLDAKTEKKSIEWLQKNIKDPGEFIAEKIKTHPLVMIGEFHGNAQLLKFISANLDRFYKAGLRTLALEVCNKQDNEQLAELLTGDTFNRGLQMKIAGAQGWLTWNFKEQWDILEAVWLFNHSLAKGEPRLRVVGIDDSPNLPLYWLYSTKNLSDKNEIAEAEKIIERLKVRDESMAKEVAQLANSSGKTLVMVGQNHAYTRYGQPKLDDKGELAGTRVRMGQMLFKELKKKVYLAIPHFQFESPKDYFAAYSGKEPIMTARLEELFKKAQIKSGAVDLKKTPLGKLRDYSSYQFHFQPEVTLEDLGDGYLYFGPLKEAPKCVLIKDFVSEETFRENRKYFELQYERKFADVKELNDLISTDAKELQPAKR